MKHLCSALFFDLDGTLIDSLEDIADAVNEALLALGFPLHTLASYTTFVGDGFENLIRQAAPPDIDTETRHRLISHAREKYKRHWARKTKPYAGIADMLRILESKKIPLAVLSNKPHELTVPVVHYFFPSIPFTHVQGSPPGERAKPNPVHALAIAATLHLRPDDIMFMGDTRTDMDTAANAGMFPIGVLWGFRSEDELVRHGAKILLREPMELFNYI